MRRRLERAAPAGFTPPRDIADAGGLLGIHDWRRLRSYTSDARTLWFSRMKRGICVARSSSRATHHC